MRTGVARSDGRSRQGLSVSNRRDIAEYEPVRVSWRTIGTQCRTGSRRAARNLMNLKKAAVGIERTNKGFAEIYRRRSQKGRKGQDG